MAIKRFILALAVCFTLWPLFAAPSTSAFQTAQAVTWVNAYHDTGDTLDTQAIVPTSDGGYLIAGYGGGLLKIDSLGVVQWQRSYRCCGMVDFVGIGNVVEVPGGYVAVGGMLLDSGTAILLLRLDSSGEVIWSKRYQAKKYNYGSKILRTRDGGYLIAGSASDGTSASRRVLLLKLGGAGSIRWQKTYNVRPVTGITQLSNGDYLFATDRFSVLRLAPGGSVRWQKKYSADGCCLPGYMSAGTAGNFTLAGQQYGPEGQNLIAVAKADPSGAVLAGRQLTARAGLELRGLTDAADGGVAINIERFDFDHPNRTTIIRLDSNLTVLWRKEYYYRPVDGLLFSTTIQQTPDQGYMIAGVGSWLAKLDLEGNLAHNCNNIVKSAPTIVHDIPIKVERHFPAVIATHATAVNESITSVLLTPTVEKICPP